MSERSYNGPRYSQRKLLLRRCLRVLVASITYYTGTAFLAHRLGTKPRVRILMYHSITEDPTDHHSVSPKAFAEQMCFLATNCNVISLDQLVDCFKEKGSLSDKPVVITLDDGLANNYTVAYPILKKHKLPATLFLVPDWIASYEASQMNETGPDRNRYTTWDQVKEMSQNAISIGAHTISHRSLPKLTREQINYELVESKARLEEKLGQKVKFFAYPYGALRDLRTDIVRMVAESGYFCAVTSLSGINDPSRDLHVLRRTEIEMTDGMWIFRKAMAGALDSWIVFQWLRWISQALRGLA